MDIGSTTPLRPHTLLKWGLMCVAIITLGAIFVGGYGGLNSLLGMFKSSPSQVAANPAGELFLSIGGASTTAAESLLVSFALSVRDGVVSATPFERSSNGPALQYSVSSDHAYGVFLAAPSGNDVDTNLSVYRADLKAAPGNPVSAFARATLVATTSSADAHREFPAISSDGVILYSSLSKKTFEATTDIGALPADAWNIMKVSTDGTVISVTTGLRPKWIDATHFAYLKNDGIYLYDLSAKSEQQVWTSANMISLVNGFDVSDNGGLVAFSDPAEGVLTVLKALNWTGNIISVVNTVSVVATNLTLSPDNTYLAALVLRPGLQGDERPITEIEYLATATSEFIPQVVPFDTDEITGIYITDWY